MKEFIMQLRRTKMEHNDNTIKVLRKILSYEAKDANDTTQLFLRLWDVLDYMTGTMTTEFNNKVEKKYELIGEEV